MGVLEEQYGAAEVLAQGDERAGGGGEEAGLQGLADIQVCGTILSQQPAEGEGEQENCRH